MKKAISLISIVSSFRLHRRRISLVTIKKSGNNMAIVLSDMLSDSIKYQNQRSAKLICDPKLIPINQKIGSRRIKILILNSGRLQISQYISFVGSTQFYIRRISFITIKTSESNKTIVLSDRISDSIKYKNQRSAKLICDPKLIPINQNRKQAD